MNDETQAELTRLQDYAAASGQSFELVAADTITRYQRSLRATRQALQDVRDARHFEQFPLSARA